MPESTTRVSSSAWIPGSHPSGPGWQSGNGATALHAAAERGHAETVRVLLDADAAHLPSMGGQTPLVTALLHRRPATARVLLEVASQRSDPCAPLHDRSAAQVARSMGYGNLARAIAGRCGPCHVRLLKSKRNRYEIATSNLSSMVCRHTGHA